VSQEESKSAREQENRSKGSMLYPPGILAAPSLNKGQAASIDLKMSEIVEV